MFSMINSVSLAAYSSKIATCFLCRGPGYMASKVSQLTRS